MHPAGVAWALVPALLASLAGCATEELTPDYEGARRMVVETTGVPEVYDPARGALSTEAIDDMLAGGLSLDESLRLALLNSRRLQAGFVALGVARADYVQAGIIENPTLGLSFLFPAGGGTTRIGADLAQQVMEAFRLPERRAVAAAGMEGAVLDLARQAGELVVDVKAAYFESVAARIAGATTRDAAGLARRTADGVRERAAQGVASEAKVRAAGLEALEADLAARGAERREAEATRRLGALLSLEADLREIGLTDALPAVRAAPADRAALIEHGRATRRDLLALDAAVRAAEERLALERERAWPDVEAGVGYERPESDDPTDHVLGPTLAVELPLFDRNEAQIARAEAELAALHLGREALLAELGQAVLAAADGVDLAADGARFLREELLPEAERAAELARAAWAAGDATLLALLDAERTLLRARATAVDAGLDAALARVALERALGGPLPDDTKAP
jgi:outer membrane protein TolC